MGHTLSELVHSEDLPIFLKAIQAANSLCKENKPVNGGRVSGFNDKGVLSVSWSARWRSQPNKTRRPENSQDMNHPSISAQDPSTNVHDITSPCASTSQEDKASPVTYRELTGKVRALGGEVILSFDWKDPS